MALEDVIRRRAPTDTHAEAFTAQVQLLTDRVREQVVEQGHRVDMDSPDAREKMRQLLWRISEEEEAKLPHLLFTPLEKAAVLERLIQTMFGFGLLDPMLSDPAVTEIMVNGPDRIFVERGHELVAATDSRGEPLRFHSAQELLNVIEKIVSPLNRKVDESDPIVDARLPDGSRVNVVLRPIALQGPVLTIRKFPANPFALDDLVRFGSMPKEVAAFLADLVRARYNLMISGGTGTGKTTFLNAVGMAIGVKERVVTVEDAAELKLVHLPNLVSLETRPPNIEGKGAIPIRDLVRTALRMRPDRIIVGEVRGGEALDMLQAMNTGHDGSITTAHANSAEDLLSRLETMVLLAGVELPLSAVRRQITSAIDVIVHLTRVPGGGRRVVQVSELLDMQGGEYQLSDLFRMDTGPSEGKLVWTGRHIKNTEKFQRRSLPVPVLGEV